MTVHGGWIEHAPVSQPDLSFSKRQETDARRRMIGEGRKLPPIES